MPVVPDLTDRGRQTDRRTDTHTHGATTVTLAAHARRGLMKNTKAIIVVNNMAILFVKYGYIPFFDFHSFTGTIALFISLLLA